MDTVEGVKKVLGDTLQLGARVNAFSAATPLLGSLPEFDSMSIVQVITAIEVSFGVTIEDDEISAMHFETVGSLSDFIRQKLQS